MSEWRTMETAPKDGTPVLLFVGVFERKWGAKDGSYTEGFEPTFMVAAYHAEFGWLAEGIAHCDPVDHEMTKPTHWMPLPEMPND